MICRIGETLGRWLGRGFGDSLGVMMGRETMGKSYKQEDGEEFWVRCRL